MYFRVYIIEDMRLVKTVERNIKNKAEIFY